MLMSRMRICLISSQIASWGKIGGFGTNTRRLGRALINEGVDVHVVVPGRLGQNKIEILDGMTVHAQSFMEVFCGKKIYREINADIYHVAEPNICGYLAQKAMPDRVHLVTSMDPRDRVDWQIEYRFATWNRRLKYPVQWFYENGPFVHKAVQRADGVYVEAEFLKQKTRRLYKLQKDPGFLPKPLEIPPEPFRKSEKPLCVFIGRFDPRKRPEVFFELAKKMQDIDFVAIGKAHDKSYQNFLEKTYFNLPNLEITGFIDPFKDHRLHEILSKAWILVHPSAREGLPTAFQEASIHEVAILSFVDPAGYASRFGRVVSRESDVYGLECAIKKMISTREWQEKGKAGRVYNIENHSLSISVKEHLDVYKKHLTNGSKFRTAK